MVGYFDGDLRRAFLYYYFSLSSPGDAGSDFLAVSRAGAKPTTRLPARRRRAVRRYHRAEHGGCQSDIIDRSASRDGIGCTSRSELVPDDEHQHHVRGRRAGMPSFTTSRR
jgi:hypothetical protein